MSFPIGHFPDAHFPNAHFPHIAVIPQGGGGGRKRKVKSYDQRQRERQEAIAAEAKRREDPINDKYGDLPKTLKEAIREAEPYKRLSPERVKAYNALRYNDDEEALTLIRGLL